MTTFEFVFSLVGLVLGLSLVEVLGGLVRTMKARGTSRVGLLTPLLGLWVLGDVTSFWGMTWGVRAHIDAATTIWPVLGVGVLITSVYYVAAALVFPDRPEEQPDFDAHYWRRKRQVVGLVWLCEFAGQGVSVVLSGAPEPQAWIVNIVVLVGAALLWWSRSAKVNVALLGVLVANAIYCFSF